MGKDNKKIVFFLGAGASAPFGVPLTSDLIPLMLEEIEKDCLFESLSCGGDVSKVKLKEMGRDLKKLLYLMMPGLKEVFREYNNEKLTDEQKKKVKVRFPLITEILSLLDHMAVNNHVPSAMFFKGEKNVQYYRDLLDRAIFEILTIYFDEEYEENEAELLGKFIDHISRLIDDGYEVIIITTNYDITLEKEIYQAVKDIEYIDFGISWRDVYSPSIHYQPSSAKLRIYKLHGSLNWLRCDLCEHLYINPAGIIVHHSFRKDIDAYGHNVCHCGNAPLKGLIVAPSFEREVRDPNLLHIWKSSAHALREAGKWVIVGYSMPPEDLAIKSLFIRGARGRNGGLPKIEVVQKGNGSSNSYSLMFGKGKFVYLEGGLEEYLKKKTC